jgi:predicted CoA-substrate-specific enzyme activase
MELENKLNLKLNTRHPVTLGIDLGSTTAKLIVVRDGEVVYSCYERHFARVRTKVLELVRRIRDLVGEETELHCAMSGSAGLGVARAAGIPFVQEVFATAEIVRALEPETTAVIELGGEDAKVIFFDGGIDERMNGSCAGGTGAFIDQMATLLDVSVSELDEMSLRATRIYPIASRCGVFAKTDIQPLLNQGAAKENIAASIYAAVVSQTIAGLAQGKKIGGRVMFLGGPLYFCRGLRKSFCEALKLDEAHALFPDYAPFAVALGAALYADRQPQTLTWAELERAVEASTHEVVSAASLPPLFQDEAEYRTFHDRHAKATVAESDLATYHGDAYLGIDCGSTTTKMTLIGEGEELLWSYYDSNRGNPTEIVREQLLNLRALCGGRVTIRSSAVTGYGEELIRHAFHVDHGLVETMAHFTAARHFDPKVDFILDIGGQDIKCFQVKDDAIDSILLNEACSSGCGSFIATFARSMGYSVEEFAKLGLFAKAPVDLGSRCTVFMNSSVKQAQKDGASVEDISAGLSMSVVRNAIYKVIRATDPDALGKRIVVQGGTFYNDTVLRSFEVLLGREVIRPTIAGLMGAYGAALYAKSMRDTASTLLTMEELSAFTYSSTATVCGGCGNHCHLTVNKFAGGETYISGAKCDRGAGKLRAGQEELPNFYREKQERMRTLLASEPQDAHRGTVGLPLALGMWELAPFWHTLFSRVGIRPVWSGMSSRELYRRGQYSIPSDTVCYPAKLMHGHIETLVEKKPTAIFYPALTYNVDEGRSQNHYNCPVVAYYGELLHGNVESLRETAFLYPYLNLADRPQFARAMCRALEPQFGKIGVGEMRRAVDAAWETYEAWMQENRQKGEAALAWARAHGKRIMILAGRPYHADPEINHAIDRLATSLGFVVVSEDSICHLVAEPDVKVLNQWTYHARLYAAARFASENKDVELVQLVSFGCGIDAITTDEVRSILEAKGKLYTQIKIDEISNLGAVTIRLRSLLGALELSEKKEREEAGQ